MIEELFSVKKRIAISILILLPCITIFLGSFYTRDKEYEDEKIDREINTIQDCVEYAKDIMDLNDKDVILNGLGFHFKNIESKQPELVQLNFVEEKSYIFWKPYVCYDIALNLKKNIATNMSRSYVEHPIVITGGDLEYQSWDFDLNNALDNPIITEALKPYEIDENAMVIISTYNSKWTYRLITSDSENITISIPTR